MLKPYKLKNKFKDTFICYIPLKYYFYLLFKGIYIFNHYLTHYNLFLTIYIFLIIFL